MTPVLLVADAVAFFPVEFVDVDLEPVADRAGIEVLLMPTVHLAHVRHHRGGSQFGAAPGRAVDPQCLEAAREGPEGIHVGQVGVVVGVQVADENIVDQRWRNLQCDRMAHASVAHVEEEPPRLVGAVAEFDQHRGALLQRVGRPGRTAQEGHPHLFLGSISVPGRNMLRFLIAGHGW